nr:redox-sensing transcriptional repressor Rex [Kineosporia succinea]
MSSRLCASVHKRLGWVTTHRHDCACHKAPVVPHQGYQSHRRSRPTVTRPRPARLVRRDRTTRDGIPEATVSRLPFYLQALTALAERGVATVSSEELASAAGVGSAKLRKDLSHLGSYGTRGVGYEVQYLIYQISRELGLTQDWKVVIVGIGNLGHALANYGGFTSRGFTVAALVDADPRVIGETVAGLTVSSLDSLDETVSSLGIQIGVVATPGPAAQEICDRLVTAGVTGVLNFAPCVLTVPDGVMVRRVDLATELQILAFHEQRRAANRLAGEMPTEPQDLNAALNAARPVPPATLTKSRAEAAG